MRYVLIAELLGVSLLGIALLTACLARIRRTWLRRLLLGLSICAAAVPWAAGLAGTIAISKLLLSGYEFKVFIASGLLAIVLIGFFILYRNGLKTTPTQTVIAAAQWSRQKLSLFLLSLLALTVFTFWNIRLAENQQMIDLMAELRTQSLSLAPPQISDSQNAAVLYRQAFSLFKAPTASEDWLEANKKLDKDSEAVIGAYLNSQKTTLSLLRQAVAKPHCNFGINYATPTFEELSRSAALGGPLHQAGKLLNISARFNAYQGRIDEAMKDISTASALCDHIRSDPKTLHLLVATNIDSISIETIEQMLLTKKCSPENFAGLILGEINYSHAFALSLQEEINWLLSLWNSWQNDPMMKSDLAFYSAFISLPEVVQDYRRSLQCRQQYASLPFSEAMEKWKEIDAIKPRNMAELMASIMLPSLRTAKKVVTKTDAKHRACLLGVAMYRYRAKYGKYPEHFEQLTPEFLLTVPMDPFDGKPMRLSKSDKGWVIYSVGPDLVDDQGSVFNNQSEKGDIAFRLAAP